jgi:hypothetical protein
MAIPRCEIHETKVCLDFHIYAILDFDLLIGYPLEKLFKEKPSHGTIVRSPLACVAGFHKNL